MLDDTPVAKMLVLILIIAFASIGILLYLPQMWSGVSSATLSSNSMMFGIGIVGVVMILISPVFFLESMYNHDYASGFIWTLLLIVIGSTLIIAWLW